MKLAEAVRRPVISSRIVAKKQLKLQSDTPEGILHELIACVPDLDRNPEIREGIVRALLAREKLSSTAMGHGIAIPHTRAPIIARAAGEPVIVFGRHPKGVRYGAPDGHPVHLFFLLIAPTIAEHLQLLATLSGLLRSQDLRERLLDAETGAQVRAAIREGEDHCLS